MTKIRPYLTLFLIIAGLVVAGKLVQAFILLPLVEAAFQGDSFEYLNQIIAQHRLKNPDVRNLAFYRSQVPVYINRLIFLAAYTTIFLWVLIKDNFKVIRAFFNEEKSAFSLGILRVVVFSLILYINFPVSISELSHLGTDSLSPPLGWPDSLAAFLIQPIVSSTLSVLFTTFCIGGLIGFYTRYMIIGATITGLFVMGIPQFFGKIDSYHILWHTLVIMSFSNAGDSLSVDAWRKNLPQFNIEKATKYAIPINLIMILIGLGYFFPGIWKFTFSGFEWAFSDNLMLKMHSKWLDIGAWTPSIRIDRYPFLYQSGAFSTLILELGFLFGIFFKKTRAFFLILAFTFHLFVDIFMHILFASTMVMFVAFLPWQQILASLPLDLNFTGSKNSQSTFYKKGLKFTGIVIIAGYLITGSLLIKTWPFALYPTFASLESSTIPSILIKGYDNEGTLVASTIPLLNEHFKEEFGSSGARLRGYMQNIINSSNRDSTKYQPLIAAFLSDFEQSPQDIAEITFYQIRLSTHPDSLGDKYTVVEKMYSRDN
ncbi:MAG: hypothetical protein CL666_11555 [Balneola sp.]|nr:hypothetical protein [Balneola sp.]|tara:strand:- start:28983 stop:30608 length:1626 start_codon:yes stop_codon:yes gene_type:complete